MKDKAFTELFLDEVEGLCYVVCNHYFKKEPFRGSPFHCDSDWDYYGYTEFEFSVYDEDDNDITDIIDSLDRKEYNRLYNRFLELFEQKLAEDIFYGDY